MVWCLVKYKDNFILPLLIFYSISFTFILKAITECYNLNWLCMTLINYDTCWDW